MTVYHQAVSGLCHRLILAAFDKQRCVECPTHEISLQTKTRSGRMGMTKHPAKTSFFIGRVVYTILVSSLFSVPLAPQNLNCYAIIKLT